MQAGSTEKSRLQAIKHLVVTLSKKAFILRVKRPIKKQNPYKIM